MVLGDKVSWWAVPVVGLMGVIGLIVGWFIGIAISAFQDDTFNVWDDEDW